MIEKIMTNSTLSPEVINESLRKHFIELDHFYLTMQNDRGDKLFDNVKKAYNLTYSELNNLYKDFKKNGSADR